ncbi:hypothetical protein HK098_004293 [Nowakowskiella sp. JEL0407]|nr:hypothetical protein HK098_004293 [Nowakowskiella sp. JEL0407]
MSLIPIVFAQYTTGIFALDMFIQSLIAVMATGGLKFFASLLYNLFQWLASRKSRSVTVRIEQQYIDAYGDYCVNDTYLALSWLTSRLSQKQQTGVFRMSQLDYWISSADFTEEMTPKYSEDLKKTFGQKKALENLNTAKSAKDPTALVAEKYREDFQRSVLDFSLLPDDDDPVTIKHEGIEFEVWFEEANQNNREDNDDPNKRKTEKVKVVEPTICVAALNNKDITLQWMYNWLIRITREYYKNQTSDEEDERGRHEYRDGYWNFMCKLHDSRGIKSVALDYGTEMLLRKDLNTFLASKHFYARIGVPYKRGIMLSGRPGVGKTSLIYAISSSLNRDLYIINLKQMKSDSVLQSALSRITSNAIVVFEDIDAQSSIVHRRDKKKASARDTNAVSGVSKEIAPVIEESVASAPPPVSTNPGANMFAALAAAAFSDTDRAKFDDSLTLSTLLGCLDGYILPEGTIVIFTTNHPEVLDPALIRPGRIDLHLELGYCTRYQLTSMYRTVMDDEKANLMNLDQIPEQVLPPCEAMRIMCLYREDGTEVVSEKILSRAREIISGASLHTDDLAMMRLEEEANMMAAEKDKEKKDDEKDDKGKKEDAKSDNPPTASSTAA